MSVPTKAPPKDTPRAQEFTRRNGTAIGAGVAALLAVVLLVGALSSGKDDGASAGETSVVVATKVIERGSALGAGATAGSLRVRQIPANEAQAGAIASITDVRGKVATTKILKGEQLTTESVSSDKGALASQVSGSSRAITVPIDAAHGMVGDVSTGDRVDVYASFEASSDPQRPPVLKAIAKDIEVLRAPSAIEGSQSNDAKATALVTLSLPSKSATLAAFGADNGKIWIVARPAAGAKSPNIGSVTLSSLLRSATASGQGS